jgi:PKD domain
VVAALAARCSFEILFADRVRVRFRALAFVGCLAGLAAAGSALAVPTAAQAGGVETIPVGGKIHVTCGGYANQNPHPNDASIGWKKHEIGEGTNIASADGAVSVDYAEQNGECTDTDGTPGPFTANSPGLYHVTVTITNIETTCFQTCGGGSTTTRHQTHEVRVVEPCDGGLFSGVQDSSGNPLSDAQLDTTGIGQGLYPGQQISTGNLAVELDLANGNVIRLGPNTKLTVPNDCLADKPDSALNLFLGSMWAKITDVAGSQIEASEESDAVGVRGSIFTASTSGGKLYYHVVEGLGYYTTGSGATSNDVPAGTTLVFQNGNLVQSSTSSSAWPAIQQMLAKLNLKPLKTGNPPDRPTPVPGAPTVGTTTTSTTPSSGVIPYAPTAVGPSDETYAKFAAENEGKGTLYELDSLTLRINGGTATGFKWNFGDPASGAKNTGSGRALLHDFSKPGTYVVTLTVTTTKGSTTVREKVKAVPG